MNISAMQRNPFLYGGVGSAQRNRRQSAPFGSGAAEAPAGQRNLTIHGLYGQADDNGNTVVGAWGDAVAGTSSTVYKPADFDPENPRYLVRIWDSDNELVEERTVDVNAINPQESDAFDMYACSCHLSDSGECPDAMSRFMMMSAYRKSGNENYSLADMLKNTDWTAVLKDFMDMQYRLGNLEGYLAYKEYYDVLIRK